MRDHPVLVSGEHLSSADALWEYLLDPASYSDAAGEAENLELIYRQFIEKFTAL